MRCWIVAAAIAKLGENEIESAVSSFCECNVSSVLKLKIEMGPWFRYDSWTL